MKPQSIKLFATIITLGLLVCSCRKHEYYQENPNEPSSANAALLLTNICISVFNNDPQASAYAARHLTYYERGNSAVDYSWTSNNFERFDILRQVKKMDELAAASGEENYQGLAKFFRAVLFSQLTEIFGDIPYSQSLNALGGNTKPAYDTQEQVYAGVLQELEEANNMLSDAKGNIAGDSIYGGKASQWKKLANAYKLRLLIHLSKKESNATLNIKQKFQAIISDPTGHPLMEGKQDNGQIVYNTSSTSNYYPTAGSLSLG